MKKIQDLSKLAKIVVEFVREKVFLRLQETYHENRLRFVAGFLSERFAFAEFEWNGQKDSREAKDFLEIEKLYNYYKVRHGLPKLSTVHLLSLWASRKSLHFKSSHGRLVIKTFWKW